MADRSVVYKIQAEVSDARAKIKSFAGDVQDAGKKMTAASKDGALLRQSMSQLGDTAGKAGLAAGAGLAFATKSAMDWETAWTGVTKTVDGTSAQLSKLEDDLRSLAKETGFSHTEVAAVAEAAGQLGISTAGIADFSRTMLDMGVSTSLSSEEAATGLARLRNIMGTSEAEIRNTGSAMVGLGNNFATTEGEILEMSLRLAGAGRQAGLTTADVLGLSASMSSVGIEAEAGGTAMSLTMKRIGKEVETNGSKLELFARTAGMSSEEFRTAWGQDAAGTLTKFVAGLSEAESMGMSTNAVLAELGVTGIREADALLRLSGNAEGLAAALAKSSEEFKKNAALGDEAGKFYGTTSQEAKQAMASIRDAAIEVGNVVLPLVGGVADAVGGMADAFTALPGPIRGGVGALAAVVAVGGTGMWAFTRLVSAVTDTREAFQNVRGALVTTKTDLGGVEASASKTSSTLGKLAGRAAGVLAVGTAVGMLADGWDRINAQDIDRSLTAMLSGSETELMKQVVDDLVYTTDKWNSIDLGEVVTLGGLFGDTTLDKKANNIEQIDQALASMVETGREADALSIFETLLGSAKEGGADVGKVRDAFDSYALAVKNAESATDGAADAQGDFAGANDAATSSVEASTNALQAQAEAFAAARQEALRAANAELNWYATLDDATAALEKNGKTVDITTEAGRANRSALIDMAAAWQELDPASREAAGGAKAAKKAFMDTAKAMGMERGEARELYRELMKIPPEVQADVVVNTAAAKANLDWINNYKFDPKTVFFSYSQMGPSPSDRKVTRGQTKSADGGTVPTTGLGYADRHPYLLADGEEVISNRYGQADKHRALLKAINENRLADGGTVGYAAGGTVRFEGKTTGFESAIRRMEKATDRLSKALDKHREKLDAIRAKQDEAGSNATSHFGLDLWAKPDAPDNPWAATSMSTSANPMGNLATNISGLEKRQGLMRRLKKAGLDKDAFSVAMTGSNEDLEALLAGGKKGVQAFEARYNRYASLERSVSAKAGDYAYGAQEAAAVREVRAARTELQKMNATLARTEKAQKQWQKDNKDVGKNAGKSVSKAASRGASKRR